MWGMSEGWGFVYVCMCGGEVGGGEGCVGGAVRSSSKSRNGIYYWDYRTTNSPSQMIASLGWDPRWHDEELMSSMVGNSHHSLDVEMRTRTSIPLWPPTLEQ